MAALYFSAVIHNKIGSPSQKVNVYGMSNSLNMNNSEKKLRVGLFDEFLNRKYPLFKR